MTIRLNRKTTRPLRKEKINSMYSLCIILSVFGFLILMVWASRHWMIHRETTRGFVLDENYASSATDTPMLSVIVAAKDEEDCITDCVRTLLEQDYPNFEVIVCNDRSEDKTAEILDELATQDERLHVLHVDHLPSGWFGKPHAMQHGIKQAKGKWLCMIDADCRQLSRKTLSVTMQYAMDTNADLLSALPQLEMCSFWENVIQPVCSGVMMIWFHPDKVNNPAKPNAYANGAFMLMKRSTYEDVGTYQAICHEVNEDMHMAGLVKRNGHQLVVARTSDLYSVRMYTSLKEILNGWTRIFFGTFGTLRRLVVSLMVMLLVSISPYLLTAFGFSVFASGHVSGKWPLVCGCVGLAAVCLQISVIFRYLKLLRGRPWLAWTYIVGCFMCVYTLVSAILKLRPGAQLVWKNTSYTTPERVEVKE